METETGPMETETEPIPMDDSAPQAVVIRTESAGAWFGYLVSRYRQEVTLERARRIWYWKGANTLSEIALAGVEVAGSKIAAPVSVTLLGVIEIIEATAAAALVMESAKWST